jgi:formate dehydrogenase iron-sulfur subunit
VGKKAILFDASRCTACRGCQVACKQWNDLDVQPGVTNRGSYENPPNLGPETWTRISFQEYERDGKLDWLFLKRGCFHCTNASCVEVCPTKALKHNPATGSVTLEPALCNGCGYCSQFCPFHVPRLDSYVITGAGKSFKCNLCQDRVTNGQLPACVQTCTAGALHYGEFGEMAVMGEARASTLKGRYPAASLYGANILGGLGQLYVLLHEPEVYGLPKNPTYTVARVWQEVVQPVAGVSFGVGLLGAAVAFVIARRNIRMEDVE